MTNFFAAIGVFVLALPIVMLLGILVIMWRTWWLYPAWEWYIVPLGVPSIAFWHFAALLLLSSVLFHRDESKKDDRATDWGKTAAIFMWPVIVWVMLWWMR